MKTKHLYKILTLGLLTLLAIGCKKDPFLKLPQTSTTVPAEGGLVQVSVDANVAWELGNLPNWVTLNNKSDNGFSITVNPNFTGSSRTGAIQCKNTEKRLNANFSITQTNLSGALLDSLVLVSFYKATNGEEWTKKWDLTQPMSRWQGVSVENGKVTVLNLPSNNLNGTLPEELGALTSMKYCDLSGNKNISGSLPTTLYQMSVLEFLDLSDNKLSGNIPSLVGMSKLVLLDLSENEFSGTFPNNIFNLTNLEYLALRHNLLNGALPSNLSILSKLHSLDLSFNSFTGTVPTQWQNLTKMKICYLHSNALNGTIPEVFRYYPQLDSLALDGNNFTGTIPAYIGSSNLAGLWLNQNRLEDPLPANLTSHALWASKWRAEVIYQQNNVVLGGGGTPAPKKSAAYRSKPSKETYKAIYKIK